MNFLGSKPVQGRGGSKCTDVYLVKYLVFMSVSERTPSLLNINGAWPVSSNQPIKVKWRWSNISVRGADVMSDLL